MLLDIFDVHIIGAFAFHKTVNTLDEKFSHLFFTLAPLTTTRIASLPPKHIVVVVVEGKKTYLNHTQKMSWEYFLSILFSINLLAALSLQLVIRLRLIAMEKRSWNLNAFCVSPRIKRLSPLPVLVPPLSHIHSTWSYKKLKERTLTYLRWCSK